MTDDWLQVKRVPRTRYPHQPKRGVTYVGIAKKVQLDPTLD